MNKIIGAAGTCAVAAAAVVGWASVCLSTRDNMIEQQVKRTELDRNVLLGGMKLNFTNDNSDVDTTYVLTVNDIRTLGLAAPRP